MYKIEKKLNVSCPFHYCSKSNNDNDVTELSIIKLQSSLKKINLRWKMGWSTNVLLAEIEDVRMTE